jgi:aryl carrier-like protein
MEVLLLDDEGGVTPPGDIGEIAVMSRYLAVGYWQEPALTAEAFRPAFDDPEARIYRTGDLGRFDKNGCLDYLGRNDFQGKVRGQRVNLADIEAEFLRVDGVREAVATIRPSGDGENQLVIYYTELANQPLNLDKVWPRLRDRLDNSSLPSALVKVERLPLNANGKVDRSALPHPHRTRLLAAAPVLPRSDIELRLVNIWKDVLDLDQVGVEDSFLDLGGDSLQLMRMLNRVRQVFGRDVSISEFVDFPCVSAMAKILLGSAQNFEGSS